MKKITKIKKVTASSKTKISEDVLKEKKEIREPENHDSDNITEKTIMLDSVNQLEINLSSMNLRVSFKDGKQGSLLNSEVLNQLLRRQTANSESYPKKTAIFFI